jgi:hypothetical protein
VAASNGAAVGAGRIPSSGVELQSDAEAGTCLCHFMVMSKLPLPEAIRTEAKQLRLPEEGTLWTDQWSNLLSVLR